MKKYLTAGMFLLMLSPGIALADVIPYPAPNANANTNTNTNSVNGGVDLGLDRSYNPKPDREADAYFGPIKFHRGSPYQFQTPSWTEGSVEVAIIPGAILALGVVGLSVGIGFALSKWKK